MSPQRWETPIGAWPAERFAPMLHDLVQWGLVQPKEGSGSRRPSCQASFTAV
jgi:hypothetical protein